MRHNFYIEGTAKHSGLSDSLHDVNKTTLHFPGRRCTITYFLSDHYESDYYNSEQCEREGKLGYVVNIFLSALNSRSIV